MDPFQSLLKEFDVVIQTYNPINYKKLQNPLPDSTISEHMNELGIKDENFRALYSWKNGVKAEYGATLNDQIFRFGALVSLEYLKTEAYKSTDGEMWSRNFFPIVMDGDSAFLLFNNEKGENYGKVHLYCPPMLYIDEPISYFDSVYTMIETTIEGYQQGALVYDKNENWLNIDSKKLNEISAKLNPNAEFWKQ